MKNFLSFVWEIIKIVLIALLIVIPIRYFLFQPFFVQGQSMEPNFEDGDYLIIDEISYRFRDPQRGEVVVFKYPNNLSQRYIKRIIGLPGETVEIENGQVIISSEGGEKILEESDYFPSSIFTPGDVQLSLGENEYFVLGDNRSSSSDSRRWGALPQEDIVGRVFLRAWPFTALAKFETPTY
jgi:signal peptidase I